MIELNSRAERSALKVYFPQTEDTLVNACLQGHMGRAIMGESWALLLVGDFAFAAGTPAIDALDWLDTVKKGQLIISGGADWRNLAAAFSYRHPVRAARYAFDQPERWDRAHLEQMAALTPKGVALQAMDAALFAQCRAEEALCDLCSAFADMDAFAAHGAGMLAVRQGRVLAGASTYAWDDDGIEVEIDTLPAFRRQGLASACGAALILSCIEKGLRVHWDAANETSMRLAQRLGYPPALPYEVIVWS